MPQRYLEAPAAASLHAEVQQFYAGQFQLLDSGAAEEWADTFTEDGSFAPPTLPRPVRGKAALAAAVREAHAALAEAGEQHRHWLGMTRIDVKDADTLGVRGYALVFATPAGGESRVHRVCVCDDVLVRQDGEWLVRERRVSRDDLS